MIMSNQGNFMVFCAEQYKMAKHLTGKQLAELFTRYRVWEYKGYSDDPRLQEFQSLVAAMNRDGGFANQLDSV